MLIVRFVKIVSKNAFGGKDEDVYTINSIQDINNIKIPESAYCFSVYYQIVQQHVINSMAFTFSYELSPKKFISFEADETLLSKQNKLANALLEMHLPVVETIGGSKGAFKRRYIKKYFESCHPEFDRYEEMDFFVKGVEDPNSNYILLPKNYEKAELIGEYYYPIIVDGKQKLMRSQPISKRTYYVGTIEEEKGNSIRFRTVNGTLGFASPEDIIIDPREINEIGIINNGKRL